MKKVSLLLALVLPATAALAAESTTHAKSATKPATIKAEVVSADAAAKKLTYKTSTGDEKTAAVATQAAAGLKTLKAGDKITLSLKEEGDEETVVSLHKATATHAHKKAASTHSSSTSNSVKKQ